MLNSNHELSNNLTRSKQNMKIIKNYLILASFILITIFQVEAQQKLNSTFDLHGLIQYNFEFHSIGDSTYAGNEFRKMVITTKGKIHNNVSYVAQFDFAGGTVGMRDIYIKFSNLPKIGGSILLGVFHESTGLDQFTGSKFKTFAERPIMASTQGFRWNSGIFYNNSSLFNNRMSIQLAYTLNGDPNAGFKNENLGKEGNFLARLTGSIINDKVNKKLLHIGAHFENRKRADKKYYHVFKPEVHMGDKFKFIIPNVESQNDYGFEIAANYKSLSFQGEYEISTFDDANNNNSISGYYGFISFFPTGEHRTYKNTYFGMIHPKKNFSFSDGGWGAIELALRYSVMDYNNANGLLPKYLGNSITDNNINNISFGINWYLNSHTRITYNYLIGDMKLKDKFKANLIKFQVQF